MTEKLITMLEAFESSRSCGVQGAGEVRDDVEDLGDAGGSTGGLEELAEVWRFLGALESADNRPVGHFGTLEQVTHHHSSHLNVTLNYRPYISLYTRVCMSRC